MKLSKRIKFLLNEMLYDYATKFGGCEKEVVYYDIGCDHGKIGCELLNRNATCRVVFCDISQTNLDKAKLCVRNMFTDEMLENYEQNCKENQSLNNLEQRCEFICCNGVPRFCNKKNKKTYNIGLIFGLGGETIKSIIQKDDIINEFYLQPTTSVLELREYLYSEDFEIVEDYLFNDGKNFYDFMYIKRKLYKDDCKIIDKNQYKIEEKYLGKDNFMRKDNEYQKFLIKQKHNLGKVLAKADENMIQLNIDKNKIKSYKFMYNLICNQIEGE